MRKCCSMRVSKSSACRLSIPSVLKKSSSGVSFSRGTLKCDAARFRMSSSVWSMVGVGIFYFLIRCHEQRIRESSSLFVTKFKRSNYDERDQRHYKKHQQNPCQSLQAFDNRSIHFEHPAVPRQFDGSGVRPRRYVILETPYPDATRNSHHVDSKLKIMGPC